MTINEAIAHTEDKANSDCSLCGDEHRRLAEWLKELKEYRNNIIKWIVTGAVKCTFVPYSKEILNMAKKENIQTCVFEDKIFLYKYPYQLKMILLAQAQENAELGEFIKTSVYGCNYPHYL